MNKLALTVTSTFVLLCTACTPEVPATPQAAKAQLQQLGNTVVEQKAAVEATVDTAKDKLEAVGTSVQAGATSVKNGLESVGNTVLSITGNEPESK